jgi:putative membrane protein
MDKIISDLNDVSVKSSEGSAALKQLETEISTEMQSCMTQIKNLTDTYNYSVKPQLNSTMNSLQGSLNQTQSVLYGVNEDFGEVSEVLNQYQAALNQGSASLSQSLTATKEMKAELDKIIVQLTELSTNKEYQEFVKLLKTDPTLLGDFVSSPVTMDTEQIYQIDNYGSAMASFYTVLALWVGALILVAIIHVKVHLEEDIPGIKDYQTFFGRYITFYLVGQVQTLITVLGNLFYLKIQCHNPFLFGLACSVTSFVFTLIMYSLTVALGNIGEALAIVIMVVQVAGAGGSFPVEVLPKIYQAIYRYLPFTYAMNALRETIGGMYGFDYWKYLLILSSFTIFSLIIGLALAVPFRKLNTMIEKSKKNTDIMV